MKQFCTNFPHEDSQGERVNILKTTQLWTKVVGTARIQFFTHKLYQYVHACERSVRPTPTPRSTLNPFS